MIVSDIYGTAAGETIKGDGANNTIHAAGGNDTVTGRNGHDTIYGGGGRDRLYGGKGHNSLTGGNGNDTFVINGDLAGSVLDTVQDFDAGRHNAKMVYHDDIELFNVAGDDVSFHQAGNDVQLFIGSQMVAIFKGSTGMLSAYDVMESVHIIGGEPHSMTVFDGWPV